MNRSVPRLPSAFGVGRLIEHRPDLAQIRVREPGARSGFLGRRGGPRSIKVEGHLLPDLVADLVNLATDSCLTRAELEAAVRPVFELSCVPAHLRTEVMVGSAVQAARSHLAEAIVRQQAVAQAHLERIARAGK